MFNFSLKDLILFKEVDKRVIVHTRDNKICIGWLRTFDCFTNFSAGRKFEMNFCFIF
jgi:small nuclear ribonucleoprotein (snRNP)-like protein